MAVTTNWWWVRHGPTEIDYLAGWMDVPANLSDTTLIGRVSEWLPNEALVVSSDLRRARDTAEAIAGERTRLGESFALREINFGKWEGMSMSEIDRQYPTRSKKYWTDPSSIAPPGGEAWHEVCKRVNAFVDETTETHIGRDIIAVAHFGVILTQFQRCTGLKFPELSEEPVRNLSVTKVSTCDGQWNVEHFSYLP